MTDFAFEIPQLEYTALERLDPGKPVDRIAYVTQRVAGKKVLDLGALDETAYELKVDTGTWLHKQMASVAREVVGIDNSSKVPDEGLQLFARSAIFRADIFSLEPVLALYGNPDIVVAGELIEHLPDAQLFLRRLRDACRPGAPEVILTTPDACSWHNIVLGLAGRESMHRDHLHVYSYKTLNTMFVRAGFTGWRMVPYHARFTEMIQGSTGAKRVAAIALEKAVNFLERRFPVLSCGWICEIKL